MSFWGWLLLRGVEPDAAERLLPHISAIVELCLDNIAQHKRARSDALTGLVSRDALLERVAGEISGIRRSFASEMEHAQTLDDASDKPSAVFEEGPPEKARESGTDGEQPWHASLGLVVLRVAGLRRIQRSCGHAFAERLLARMGDALRSVLPGRLRPDAAGTRNLQCFCRGRPRGMSRLLCGNGCGPWNPCGNAMPLPAWK